MATEHTSADAVYAQCPDIDPAAAWQVRALRDSVGTAKVRAYLDYLDLVAALPRCDWCGSHDIVTGEACGPYCRPCGMCLAPKAAQ
jgi:hypothetical protein